MTLCLWIGLHGSVLHIQDVGLTQRTPSKAARSLSVPSQSVLIAVTTGVAQAVILCGYVSKQSTVASVVGVSLIRTVFFDAC